MEDWGEESEEPLPILVGDRNVAEPDLGDDTQPEREQDWGEESPETGPVVTREPA